ncbi:hypothetical protein GRAN_4983 [Granulicella sibirica]|uniref:Uncharacterized protein n=1 Tax=Granulicella sibirica TaxID=2479048 RepID=A0A4V1L4Z8_9BACT|nr:hypothetical protein GRAN_4983 [Granulicella sibirica]
MYLPQTCVDAIRRACVLAGQIEVLKCTRKITLAQAVLGFC